MTFLDTGISNPLFMIALLVIVAWEAVWKGIALWKTGRNNQLGWFIALLILLNTAGILPILYILFFQKSKGRKR